MCCFEGTTQKWGRNIYYAEKKEKSAVPFLSHSKGRYDRVVIRDWVIKKFQLRYFLREIKEDSMENRRCMKTIIDSTRVGCKVFPPLLEVQELSVPRTEDVEVAIGLFWRGYSRASHITQQHHLFYANPNSFTIPFICSSKTVPMSLYPY